MFERSYPALWPEVSLDKGFGARHPFPNVGDEAAVNNSAVRGIQPVGSEASDGVDAMSACALTVNGIH